MTDNTGGGGEHRIFEYPEFSCPKRRAGGVVGTGIDVLSDGCIGSRRQVAMLQATGIGGRKISHSAISNPAPLPEPWLERLRGNTPAQPDADKEPAQPLEPIPEGQRNSHRTSLAGALQRGGASREAIAAALMAENTARCIPPDDSTEIEGIVASIGRYSSAALSERSDPAEILLQALLDRHFTSGKSLTFGTDGRFWRYSGKYWKPSPSMDRWTDPGNLCQTSPVQTSANSAGLLRQVGTLLEAKLATNDDFFAFTVEPLG